jgi:hypothetical protein
MKFTIILALLAGHAVAQMIPASGQFIPPTASDSRSPCPLLNTLSNHGFMARNGLNISISEMVRAMDVALNLDPSLTQPIVELGATTSTTGINGTMNLEDLNQHRGKLHVPSTDNIPTHTRGVVVQRGS